MAERYRLGTSDHEGRLPNSTTKPLKKLYCPFFVERIFFSTETLLIALVCYTQEGINK